MVADMMGHRITLISVARTAFGICSAPGKFQPFGDLQRLAGLVYLYSAKFFRTAFPVGDRFWLDLGIKSSWSFPNLVSMCIFNPIFIALLKSP